METYYEKCGGKWTPFQIPLITVYISTSQIYAHGLLSLVMICYPYPSGLFHWQSYDYPGANEAALNPLPTRYYSDVIMGAMASQITIVSIVYSTVCSRADQRKHKAPRHRHLWGEFTGDRWIPLTKGQYRGKLFHWLTSSCDINKIKQNTTNDVYILRNVLYNHVKCHRPIPCPHNLTVGATGVPPHIDKTSDLEGSWLGFENWRSTDPFRFHSISNSSPAYWP